MSSYISRMVAPTRLPDPAERQAALEHAGYNVFGLTSDDVFIDLLTDSGTGTMSTDQWAALLAGDESYAGSRSFEQLRTAITDVLGFEQVVPAHQGRGAEHLLYGAIVEDGDIVPANTHFDTTRAHIANAGGEPVDCPHPDAWDRTAEGEFKGNLAIDRVREVAEEVGHDRIPAIVVTITNNSAAGQPVSIENLQAAREVAEELDARLVIDGCRFAENAWFVQDREPEYTEKSIPEIVRTQSAVADAIVVSGKKDGLANVGGFLAIGDNEEALFEQCKQRAILYEGFPTYGGMAGRDMAAMAVGLREAVENRYLDHRIGQVRELADGLEAAGVPVYRPVGGHAVYIDASEALPSIPPEQFPAQALVCEAYLEGGIRSVELGSLAFPDADRPELVRLALPRRTYHREHLDHVIATFEAVLDRAGEISGLEIIEEPPMGELRHFSAELAPIDAQPVDIDSGQ